MALLVEQERNQQDSHRRIPPRIPRKRFRPHIPHKPTRHKRSKQTIQKKHKPCKKTTHFNRLIKFLIIGAEEHQALSLLFEDEEGAACWGLDVVHCVVCAADVGFSGVWGLGLAGCVEV